MSIGEIAVVKAGMQVDVSGSNGGEHEEEASAWLTLGVIFTPALLKSTGIALISILCDKHCFLCLSISYCSYSKQKLSQD